MIKLMSQGQSLGPRLIIFHVSFMEVVFATGFN